MSNYKKILQHRPMNATMNCIIAFHILLILLAVLPAWGATFYIDPTCPSSGDGTTTTCGTHGPFKTWAEVSWVAGNTYSQKGGTTAYETITVGASGAPGKPITINSYGTGKAILNGGVEYAKTNWTEQGNGWWKTNSTNIFAYPPYSYALCTENDVFLKYGPGSGNFYSSEGYSYYKPTDGTWDTETVKRHRYYGILLGMNNYITITGLKIKFFNYGVSALATMTSSITDLVSDASDNTKVSSAARKFVAGDVGKYLDIYHSDGNSGSGWLHTHYVIKSVDGANVATLDKSCGGTSLTRGYALLGAAQAPNNITINDCDFSDMFVGIWLDTYNATSSNGVITNNSFEYIRMNFEAQIYGDCKGGRGAFDNFNISYNTITHGNEVRGAPYSWELVNTSNWDEEGIGVQAMTNSNLHHNTIDGGDIRGFVLFVCAECDFANNNIYNNYVNVKREAIMQYPDESGIASESYYENPTANAVYNNSYYNNVLITGGKGYGAAIYAGNVPTPVDSYNRIYNNTLISPGNGVYFSANADYFEVKNNIIYHGSNYQIYIPGSPAHMNIDYNLYKPSVAWTSFSYGGAGKNYAQWKALGYDVHSRAVADPLFSDAAAGKYTLTSLSPAKWAGVNVGLSTDFAGKPVHDPPSIGAYEYDTTPAPVNLRIK